MTTLREQLSEAEATAEHLRRRIAAEACDVAGHDWHSIGGRNAGCQEDGFCSCSVPVHECAVCGDCDYGDNDEADQVRGCCLRREA
jgi:hypothetical protein